VVYSIPDGRHAELVCDELLHSYADEIEGCSVDDIMCAGGAG
jgi:hypothetical protein